jgi:hypothetical protein
MLERLDNRNRCLVRVPAELLAPCKGRVYDPCCGSAAMFVMRLRGYGLRAGAGPLPRHGIR